MKLVMYMINKINNVYDLFLGPSLDKFPTSKLPQHRVLLQRYRALSTEGGHNALQSETIMTKTKELTERWECSSIHMNNCPGCWDIVKDCVNMWPSAKKEVKQSFMLQNQLDRVLGLRPVIYMSSSGLKEHLRNQLDRVLGLRPVIYKSSSGLKEHLQNQLDRVLGLRPVIYKSSSGLKEHLQNQLDRVLGLRPVIYKSSSGLKEHLQNQLDRVLGLRPVIYKSSSGLKEHLQKSNNVEWNSDYEFFKGQLKPP